MRTQIGLKKLGIAAALSFAAVTGVSAPAHAQIPALLPNIGQVEPIAPLSIDGTWRIREINELIILDRGHAYAVDGWTHALIFKVMPRHVVLADLVERPDGTIEGRDLPLMAPITIEPIDAYTLRVTAHGLVPIVYHLDLADPQGALPPDVPSNGDDWFAPDDEPGDEPGDTGDESWFPAEPDD